MNELEMYIRDGWHDDWQVMNYLQDAGIVSDNAVRSSDVCGEDAERAVRVLKKINNEHI